MSTGKSTGKRKLNKRTRRMINQGVDIVEMLEHEVEDTPACRPTPPQVLCSEIKRFLNYRL
jgi:hypothetical protein